MISSVLHLAASRERVFAVLTDYGSYSSWIPWCSRSAVLNSIGNRTDAELVLTSMRTISVTVRFDANPHHSLRFEMLRSSHLKAYSGEYRLMPAASGEGTVVVSEIEIDAGATVPHFLLVRSVRRLLDELGVAIQSRLHLQPAIGPQTAVPERKRNRRILQIARTSQGYRIWYLGRVYGPQDKP